MRDDFSPDAPLVLVGAGKMGGAMLHGWVEAGLSTGAGILLDPMISDEMASYAEAHGLVVNPGSTSSARVLIIAIKPQMMDTVLPDLRRLVGPSSLIMSVAAGIPMSTYTNTFGDNARIIRAMPNTPAAVGRGMTVGYANAQATADDKDLAQRLLEAVGQVAWITEEKHMDAVTALSGSGPAYVFHMVEAMAAAGVAEGLDKDLAMQLARETVAGAGELLHQSDEDASTLRINVTSPGGTTQAALEVLMGGDGQNELMQRAIAAAARRSRELAG